MAVKKDNRNEKAKENQSIRRRNRHSGIADEFDWTSADANLLANAVVAVTRTGAAVQFGRTRDGGSAVIRIVGDGPEPYNEYVRATENIDVYLQGLADDFENVERP